MAYTPLDAPKVSPYGVLNGPPYPTADPVNGNSIPNTGLQTQVAFDNRGGTEDVTVTFHPVATLGGYPFEDVVVVVPAGERRVCKNFPVKVFGSTLGFTASAAVPVVSVYC